MVLSWMVVIYEFKLLSMADQMISRNVEVEVVEDTETIIVVVRDQEIGVTIAIVVANVHGPEKDVLPIVDQGLDLVAHVESLMTDMIEIGQLVEVDHERDIGQDPMIVIVVLVVNLLRDTDAVTQEILHLDHQPVISHQEELQRMDVIIPDQEKILHMTDSVLERCEDRKYYQFVFL